MSAKLRAGRTFPFVLASERDNPESVADPFAIRVLSADSDSQISELRGQWLELSAVTSNVDRLKSGGMKAGLLRKMLELAVDGIDPAEITAALTEIECWELINAATEGATLSAEERKKFVSPLQSEKDSIASGVVSDAVTV